MRAKEISDGELVEFTPLVEIVDTLPTELKQNTFYIVGKQTFFYDTELRELYSNISVEKEIGEIVIGDSLTTQDIVISRYGGVEWEQLYGELYSVGGTNTQGIGITTPQAVSQSLPNTTYQGNNISTSSNGAHTHTITPQGTITYTNTNYQAITKNGYVRPNGLATYIWRRIQ